MPIFPPLENHIITRVQSTLLLPQSCLPTASMTKPWRRSCDLCKTAAASVHCDSDDAFLCLNCDSHVHGANFLVARHLRKTICSSCHLIDSRGCFSGAKLPPFHRTICSECRDHRHQHSDSASDDSSSSFSSSSCISAAENTDLEIQRWRRRRKRKPRRTDVSGVPSKHVFLNESSYVDDEGWGESSSSSSTS